jgi:hypothetical protein
VTEENLIARADAAFQAGNFHRVRELATQLVVSKDPKEVDAGRALLEKVSVDPAQYVMIGASAVLLVVLFALYVIR